MSECDHEMSIMKRPWSTKGCCAVGGGGGRKNPESKYRTSPLYRSISFVLMDVES